MEHYTPTNKLSANSIEVVQTFERSEEVAQLILEASKSSEIVVGADCEGILRGRPLCLIQVSENSTCRAYPPVDLLRRLHLHLRFAGVQPLQRAIKRGKLGITKNRSWNRPLLSKYSTISARTRRRWSTTTAWRQKGCSTRRSPTECSRTVWIRPSWLRTTRSRWTGYWRPTWSCPTNWRTTCPTNWSPTSRFGRR